MKPEHGEAQKTILVADDEQLMLRLLEKFFSRCGYRVLCALDGKQAVDIYRCHKSGVDAILLDIRLPTISGREVFRLLKEENAAVKVVMTSGYIEPAARDDLGRAGVLHFVEKPYEISELRDIFDSLIQGR